MVVKTFVLGAYESFDKQGRNVLVLYRGSVLAEELAHHLAVGGVDNRSLALGDVVDVFHCGTRAEQPQKIDVYQYYKEKKFHQYDKQCGGQLNIPFGA